MVQEPSKNHPHSFIPFWRIAIKEAWNESREKFGLFVDIILLITAFVLFGMAWYSKHHPKFDADKENSIMSYWFALIPAVVWLVWFGWHVLKVPHKMYLEIYEKLQKEIERNTPKFMVSCNKETEGCAFSIPASNAAFFRMRVVTDCFGGIKNCRGNLLRIEKDGIVIFGHDTPKLPFAKSEDPKCLEKTIAQNTPEWLDILFIIINQPHTELKCAESHLAYQAGEIPNNHNAKSEDNESDVVYLASKPLSAANDKNGKYIFAKPGEYILHVNVIGDMAPTEPAKLKFNWTGHFSNSSLEKIA
jgi:hypothetical protein